ncbi:hypothetical protein OG946_09395 [Streptomyces sp. NBC_01808]|nr:hypothetical protein [Streptomyces sp. NBC_01808]WSA37582.1 hypothetical protein OG946_09395 [Streptomyces sp. NBC_01808]
MVTVAGVVVAAVAVVKLAEETEPTSRLAGAVLIAFGLRTATAH